jgi:hypothetical protein
MEIAEIFAAKRLLMVRAPHRNTFDSNVASTNDFKHYFSMMGSRFRKRLSATSLVESLHWKRNHRSPALIRQLWRMDLVSFCEPWLQSLDWPVYAHKFLRTM